jgi:ribonuclease Z
MLLTAYSKAIYSNWYYYAPDRILLDCGEGMASFMRAKIFAIDHVFLSHGHMDHTAGLVPLLFLRQSTKGSKEKPLTIYYPAADRSTHLLKEFAEKATSGIVHYPLKWVGIGPGHVVELKKGRSIEAFSANHNADDPLGFRILERRRKLRPELSGKPGKELASLPEAEKYSHYDAKLLCYSGDSMPLDPEVYLGAQILLHDATFLRAEDRNELIHATAQEVFDLANESKVERVILTHISPRYETQEQIETLLREVETHGIPFKWVPHDRVVELP